MKKGLLITLVSIAMALVVFVGAAPVNAAGIMGKLIGNYRISENDDGTLTIVSWYGGDEYLQIPDEIEGKKVTKIGINAFYEGFTLKNVTIPNTVKEIGAGAFTRCQWLERIEIPASVTTIGDEVFRECSSLTDIVVSLDSDYFEVIDGALISKNEKSLVCLPPGLKLRSFTIPDGVESVSSHAFYDCETLEEVKLPDSLIRMEEYSLSSCTNLKSIEIPDSVEVIGRRSFLGCHNLLELKVSPGNEYYKSIDNVLFSKDGTKLIWYLKARDFTEYFIPDGVESIEDDAFSSCTNLTKIEMPDTVISIGKYAFCFCTNLKEIKISASLETIKDAAFSNCNSLTEIELPNTVKEIGNGAIACCSNLKRALIPESVTNMGVNVFSMDDDLFLIVGRDSYAAEYAREYKIPYVYYN